MIELTSPEFLRILPLLAGIEQKVLPYAICEGINPGRVFVDRPENPTAALIWTTVGYYFLCGKPQPGTDLAGIAAVLSEEFLPASQAAGETGFILIPSHDSWKAHLPALLPGREVIEIYRRPFAFDPARFAACGDWRAQIPPGFRLQALDASLAERAGVLASWATIEDFLANGLGFAILAGDEIASVCLSVFATRAMMELDVHTGEKFRRRGLAQAAASALIEACLQSGRQPNWECFWENEPSTSLALKLGFTPLPDYPVMYWEEKPLKEKS